jgi:hypothetical protein
MVDRRQFLERSALFAGASALARFGDAAPLTAAARTIGIQIGAVSFVDEGTGRVLEGLADMAAVNTLFVATFTYGRGIGGRQPRPNVLPDHGVQEYDDDYHGGNFATPHPEYYRASGIVPEKAPDHQGYDVLADVLPHAHARGMSVIAWFEDWWREDVPGHAAAREIDLHGRPGPKLCFRNPDTRGFWLGLVEDLLRSYEVDGLMWGSERQGPLDNALGASNGGRGPDPGLACCFCAHCVAAAVATGIDVERARRGYLALEQWAAAIRDGHKPDDGAFVTFWRTLTDYPEVLAWERLWNEGLRDTYRAMKAKAHALAPGKPMGWHLWHTNSFAPFLRAEQDYAAFAEYSDFLKVVLYNNCGGARLARYVRNANATLLADLTADQALAFIYATQQYGNEAPLDRLPREGLSADYVLRETRRARASAGPSMKIWPGIDIDVPTAEGEKKTQPDDVYASVSAAFAGGADGVVLCRKYSEMRLANLRAAGRAVRELKPA